MRMIRILPVIAALGLALAGVTPAFAIDIKEVKSKSGVTAWLVENHSVPVISLSFTLRTGAVTDPKGKEGRAEFVAATLDEGAGDMESQEFQGRLEDLSIRLRFNAGLERFSGSLRTLSENRDEAFWMLAMALNKPRFDAEPVARIRGQMIAGLKSTLQRPGTIAGRAWYRAVFDDHPYGRPTGGTVDSVGAITAGDLKDFVSNHLSRAGMVVGVAGDITPEELSRRLDQIFGALPKGGNAARVAAPKLQAAGKTVVIDRNVPQSVVIFGQRGIERDDPDWYAAYIMNRILGGGGFSARLMEEVREKRGLAYGVYSYLNPFEKGGLIMGSVGTGNARVAESLRVIKDEWRKMAENGVTAEELQNAKTYINGSFPLRLDSTRRIARILAGVQFNRLGIDYLNRRAAIMNAVTVDDIKRVAKRLLDADAMTVVVVGKPKGLQSSP